MNHPQINHAAPQWEPAFPVPKNALDFTLPRLSKSPLFVNTQFAYRPFFAVVRTHWGPLWQVALSHPVTASALQGPGSPHLWELPTDEQQIEPAVPPEKSQHNNAGNPHMRKIEKGERWTHSSNPPLFIHLSATPTATPNPAFTKARASVGVSTESDYGRP